MRTIKTFLTSLRTLCLCAPYSKFVRSVIKIAVLNIIVFTCFAEIVNFHSMRERLVKECAASSRFRLNIRLIRGKFRRGLFAGDVHFYGGHNKQSLWVRLCQLLRRCIKPIN